MGTIYFREFDGKEIRWGRSHTDSLEIREGDLVISFWYDEIDKLIQAVKEVKLERERCKKIDEEEDASLEKEVGGKGK